MAWGDKEDAYTPEINEAHPLRTGEWATYHLALELVSNRRSKSALVELVHYLLLLNEKSRGEHQ